MTFYLPSDSELGECTAADEVSPVTMEAEDSAASVSEKDEDEEDNSATPVPSVSDFDDGKSSGCGRFKNSRCPPLTGCLLIHENFAARF